MLARLDAFLLARVFQPMADALSGITTPTGAARFCVTGAMVFVIAGMLASTATALPTLAILLDVANLWAGMAMLHHFARSGAGSANAYRSMFGLARPVLACCTISFWIIGADSLAGSFVILRFTL